MKLAEILTGPETWCQDEYSDGSRVCLLGAVRVLIPGWQDIGTRDTNPEVARMYRAIESAHDARPQFISDWNDSRDRTWDEIAAVVDAYDRDRMLSP